MHLNFFVMRTFIHIIACLLSMAGRLVEAQEQAVYRTETFREDIKSLEVKVQGELFSTPYIELNGEQIIEISFDALHHSSGRFAYSVLHCNADWKQSNLLPVEYLKGFQRLPIDNVAYSIGTTTLYAHCRVTFPNENTQLSVSGNYAVQVFDEETPGKPVLTACFSIVEPLIEIEAGISGNTDIDFNREHQQIEFVIHHKNLKITYPQTDLKVFVYQNNNRNDIRGPLQPLMIINNQLQYRRNRELIFEAGNEYRRIEFLTHRFNGMGVEAIAFYNPYYHVTLNRDQKRDKKPYIYDQDHNGRFFIRCYRCDAPDYEGDYYVVHFSLVSEPLHSGTMHLYGDFTNHILDSKSLMEYNPETGAYEKAVLLKTGHYNYQYVFLEKGDTKPSFKRTEGAFYETENEYTIAVYFRPIGERYDRLIGCYRAMRP